MPNRNLEQLVNTSAVNHLSNVTVTVCRQGLPEYDAQAVDERPYTESEDIAGYQPSISGLTAELDPNNNVNERTQVRIGGELFRVAGREPDGTGFERWVLERDQSL